MELRHLRYFIAVAEELHFSRAAERLHVAQPAVSEQVRKLEQELGVRLLNRTKRTASLTDAGAALLVEARRVLQQVEMARLATHEARDRVASRLRIGYTPASLPISVPRALQPTRRVDDGSRDHSGGRVRHGAGRGRPRRAPRRRDRLAACPDRGTTHDTTGLRAGGGSVAGDAPSRGAARHPPRPGRARAASCSSRARPTAPSTTPSLRRASSAGLSPSLVEPSGACVEPALLAVASGAGIGLLPESVADRYSTPGVRFVSIDGEQPAVSTAIVTRRDSAHLPTAAFLRTVSGAHVRRTLVASGTPVPDGRLIDWRTQPEPRMQELVMERAGGQATGRRSDRGLRRLA